MEVASSEQRSLRMSLDDTGQAGEARRAALALGERVGLNETDRGRLAIVVTELATNIVRHAREGKLIMRPLAFGSGSGGVEVLGIDKGPGMDDVARAMDDGFSTAGSAGQGLGAMKRQSNLFDLHSSPGKGTVIVCRVWDPRTPLPEELDRCGVISVPVAGETACGDGWAIGMHGSRTVLMMVDGLGHGPLAAEAAKEAVRVLEEVSYENPPSYIQDAHAALRKTRGAALSIAELDSVAQQVRFCGLGNISGVLLGQERVHRMVSQNGTAGAEARKIQEFTYPLAPRTLLVMHSDGIVTRWDLGAYPGIMMRHPAVIAGVIYRDFERGRDDATVLVRR